MIVTHPKSFLNNGERYAEKIRITLPWVGNWTFSTIELLSARLNQPASSTTLFFKRLIDEGYLVRFTSDKFRRKDLVRIGAKGVEYLKENFGYDAKRYMRSDELAAKKKIYHDYCAQVYAASLEQNYNAIFSEINIIREKGQRRPDGYFSFLPSDEKKIKIKKQNVPKKIDNLPGLITTGEKFWYDEFAPEAIEYESECKKPKVARAIFKSYFYQLIEGKVSRVHFVFPNEKFKDRYMKYFSVERWHENLTLPPDHPARERFTFEVLDPDQVISKLSIKKWVDDTEFFMLTGRWEST